MFFDKVLPEGVLDHQEPEEVGGGVDLELEAGRDTPINVTVISPPRQCVMRKVMHELDSSIELRFQSMSRKYFDFLSVSVD